MAEKQKKRKKETPKPINPEANENFVIVDSSYLVFYRFYATILWYKRANKDVDVSGDYSWHTDTVFLNKYKKIFFDSITKLKKHFKVPNKNIIFAIDCSRKSIWRMEHLGSYKANRDDKVKSSSLSHIFKYTYSDVLPELVKKYNVKQLKVPHAEADDVAAITTRCILEEYPDKEILIITNDCDYLQLLQPRVHIWNLAGKNIAERSIGDPKVDLELKIITGDKSDNIEKCFPKCGTKTALKYIDDRSLLEAAFKKYPGSREIYERNKLIIDFNKMPSEIINIICEKFHEIDF